MFDNLTTVLDLGAFGDEEKAFLKSDIGSQKLMNGLIRKSRLAAKKDSCFYCGEKCDSFCNSHSIPAFCLRNIASNGDVLTLNAIVDNPFLKSKKGVNNSGTFQLICRDCDSKIFCDYENPSNYTKSPTPSMINQIALKNSLKSISKRLIEIEMLNITEAYNGHASGFCQAKNYINDLDLKEYLNSYNKAKNAIAKNHTSDYYVCYHEKLDYVVPIAFQASLALIFDFEGNIINDTFYSNPDYKIQNINICIFPLEKETVIIMFIESGDKRYRKFYKQFNKLSLDDKLLALTFIMFAYSEDMYFSKSIEKDILSSPQLCEAGCAGQDILSLIPVNNPIEKLRKTLNLDNRHNIPNLLSEKYKLR